MKISELQGLSLSALLEIAERTGTVSGYRITDWHVHLYLGEEPVVLNHNQAAVFLWGALIRIDQPVETSIS